MSSSLLMLLAANLAALVIAYWAGMSLRDLMLVYWIQSVVIGVTSFIRILRLRNFDTSNFRMNGRPLEQTDAAKRAVAFFFAMHYGIFHLVYFIFIAFAERDSLGSLAGYLVCAVIFALNHGYSLRQNLERDAAGRPSIGTLMFLPYARIVPMHATILVGGVLAGGTLAFFLFGLLKTLADLLMHVIEHRVLAKQ